MAICKYVYALVDVCICTIQYGDCATIGALRGGPIYVRDNYKLWGKMVSFREAI